MEKKMFDRILLPMDISEMPEIIVPYAEELAGKFGSELILYYVRAQDPEESKHLTLDYLDRLAETIKQNILKNDKKEITVTTKIAEGEPAQNICELVDKNKIDLIIASHQHADHAGQREHRQQQGSKSRFHAPELCMSSWPGSSKEQRKAVTNVLYWTNPL